MATKLYPIGMQTFSEIREEDFLYVDKTEFIYRMTHTSGKYFFLNRPRRFGKSLLVSTMQSYFEGKKELFKGLAIEKLEKDWTEYPVLHFSLAGGKHMEKDQLVRYLLYILNVNEEKFGIVNDSPDPNVRMLNLIKTVYEQTGQKVVVLIDEYDAPLLYQSGYITIKNYDPETELYTLALPNKEVRIGLFRSMLPHYLAAKSAMCNTTVAKMSALINKGNMDGALQLLKTFWETVPYCDNTDYEGHYQQTMYIIFALLTNFRILVEQHTFRGRTDITMETKDTIYVIELKFNKSAQEALDQINNKHYADAFALRGKTVEKIGMNFMIDENKTIVLDWWKFGE